MSASDSAKAYQDVGEIRSRTIFFRSADGESVTTGVFVPAPKRVTVVIQAGKSVPEVGGDSPECRAARLIGGV